MTDTANRSRNEPDATPTPASGGDTGFRLLGPLEVTHHGEVLEVPAGRQQALLAALLLRPGEVVSAPTLIEQVWGGDADRTVLNVCVMRLRRSLKDPDRELVRAEGNGYRIAAAPDTVDLHRFRKLCERAGTARHRGDPAAERDALHQALALWRGDALSGVASSVLQAEVVPILEEERLAAIERRVDADLEHKAHAEVIGELRQLVADHPFRERFWCQLLLALYRAGRQSEALDAYRTARERLADELGIEPGQELRELHRHILTSDPTLLAPRPAEPSAPRIVPAQLPPATAGFSGRRDQLRQLDRLLDDTEPAPTTLITGPPGAGKTTLAVHWASRHRDRWPDGQLYIDLRGYGPEPLVQPIEALAYFLRAIGLPADQVPPQQAEASALFRSQIAGRRLLIVLDNAAIVDQVRPLLPGGGDCLAIVTSRDRLTGLVAKEGARVLSVDVMADAEAQTLLSDALGDARLAAEPDAAAALARLCGNLPLALRITAADLINHPQRSLTRHADRLRTGNRLDALQVADDDGTAVRAAFRSSYARLPEPVRRLFRLLGLFPGSEISLESAASLAGVEAAATEPLLDRLISAHLVTPRGAERFALHDLLRLFAQELGQEEDADAEREAAMRRLYDHYSRVAVAAADRLYSFVVTLPLSEEAARIPVRFDDDTTASAWFDTEHPNLVALVRYAADRGDHLDACRLAAAMQSYLHSKMHAVDWLNVARAYLFAARQIVDFRAQILAHLSLANLHRSRAQRNAAIKHFEQALALSRHSGWVDGQSITHNNLSGVYDYEGKLRLTVHHLHQALELRTPTRDITSKAVVLSNLGRVLLRLGHVEEAVDHLERATNIHQRRGARVSESRSRASLGEALCELGQHHRALALLNHAVAVQRELDDRMFLPNTLCRLANAHLDVGQTDLAADLVSTAMALVRETGHRRSEAWVTYVTARVDEHTGCPDAALDGYAQALRLGRERGNGYLQVQAMIGMSSAHHQLGQRESARRCIDKALARARRFEYALLERQAEAVRVALC